MVRRSAPVSAPGSAPGPGIDLTARFAAGDTGQPPDDGSAPPQVAVALSGYANRTLGLREVVAALSGARLLVPLLEVSGEVLEASETDPCSGTDKAVAVVSMRTPDGSVGLAFTSLAALTAWNPEGRPWPSPADRVAAALLGEGGVRLIIDPGSPHALALAGVALHRLATGADWPDPWEDPAVRDAVVCELAPVLASGEIALRLGPPDPSSGAGLNVEVAFALGTDAALVQQRAGVIARRLAASAALRTVFDRTLEISTTMRRPATG
jgi:SseB protein N-terminal domain